MLCPLQAASAQQLQEAMTWALRNDTSLKADDARQDATRQKLRGSIDAFLPQVGWVQESTINSKISYNSMPATVAPGDTLARREPNAYGIQATLPLFDGFKRINEYHAASLTFEAGKFLQINARQQVLLDAAQSYLAVYRDRRIVTLRRRQVDDIGKILDSVRVRFSLKDATLTDVSLAESRLFAARAALEQSLADQANSQNELARVTGSVPGNVPAPTVPNALVPKSMEDLQNTYLHDNPNLAAARLTARAADYSAKAARSEVMPKLNLYATHGIQTGSSDVTPRITDTTVKFQLRIPLYEPGALPRIEEARALAKQKGYEVIDTEIKNTTAIKNLYNTRISLLRQVSQANDRVGVMQKAVEGYKVELAAGYRTTIDVLNALGELNDAMIFRANLEFNRDKATYTLLAALARLDAGPVVASR